MKKKPIVGITHSDAAFRDHDMRVRTYCTHKYHNALQQAGATVILLPPVETPEEMETYFGLIDGLVLPGGEDVDPRFQNEDPSFKLGLVNPWRDAFEIRMVQMAHQRKLPTLGICRGIQVMAIAMGGSVHQDIASLNPIQHTQNAPRWATSHKVALVKNSRLRKILKEEAIFTNSFHHQAVNKVPGTLRVVGKTGDGLIEALESPEDFFFAGVQWHPEELAHCDNPSQRLFQGFLQSLK